MRSRGARARRWGAGPSFHPTTTVSPVRDAPRTAHGAPRSIASGALRARATTTLLVAHAEALLSVACGHASGNRGPLAPRAAASGGSLRARYGALMSCSLMPMGISEHDG